MAVHTTDALLSEDLPSTFNPLMNHLLFILDFASACLLSKDDFMLARRLSQNGVFRSHLVFANG